MRAWLLVILIALPISGCGSGAPPEIGTCTPDQVRLSGTGVDYPPAMPAEIVDRSGCDAADRAKVPVESVEIVSATSETWPDFSLGCPGAGGAGAAVNIDGFRLVLRAGNQTFDYHTGRPSNQRTTIKLCGQSSG